MVGVGVDCTFSFLRGRHAQLMGIPMAFFFVGVDDDREESVKEIRKFKKSRKQKKATVMCDG